MPISLVSARPVLDGYSTLPLPAAPRLYVPAILSPYEPSLYTPVVPQPVPNPLPTDPLPTPGAMEMPVTFLGYAVPPALKGLVDPIRGVFPVRTGAATMPLGADPLQKMGPAGAPVWVWVGIIVLLILLVS